MSPKLSPPENAVPFTVTTKEEYNYSGYNTYGTHQFQNYRSNGRYDHATQAWVWDDEYETNFNQAQLDAIEAARFEAEWGLDPDEPIESEMVQSYIEAELNVAGSRFPLKRLPPCGYCGEEVELIWYENEQQWSVSCQCCMAFGPWGRSKYEAITRYMDFVNLP